MYTDNHFCHLATNGYSWAVTFISRLGDVPMHLILSSLRLPEFRSKEIGATDVHMPQELCFIEGTRG